MRAFIVLLALVATPFVASVAQDPAGSNPGVRHAYGLVNDPPGLGHDALHCAMRADLHPGTDIFNKCDPPAPGGSGDGGSGGSGGGSGGGSPPPVGTAYATGFVFDSASGQPAPQTWGELDLSVGVWDDATGVYAYPTVNATAGTDATGLYTFTDLAGGSYMVCAAPNTGWRQTNPNPSTAPCYKFPLADGAGAGGLKFKVAPK